MPRLDFEHVMGGWLLRITGHVQREGIVIATPNRRRTTRAASTSCHASARSGKAAGTKSRFSLTQIAKHKPDPLPRCAQINAGGVVPGISELGPLVQVGSVLSIRRSCFNWRSNKSANHLCDEPPRWRRNLPFSNFPHHTYLKPP
jgi:hypothetical protein